MEWNLPMSQFPAVERLLLVGWDAADWKVIDPLMAKGEMPNLAWLVSDGVRGNLGTMYPALSPMLWTSIATGKRPSKHGIHGFSEPANDGLGVRPITNLGRKTKAFWNILNQNGKRSLVVGWWPSHPAEPIRGAMVSNHFPPPTGASPDGPMMTGTVYPERWADPLAELRVHAMEVTGDILQMFAPDWAQVDQDKDKSVHDLAGLIAETMSIHCAATELMAKEPWDLAAIYFAGIDHFSHRFMRYHAGKRISQKGTNPGIFTDIVANAYRYHDAMLGRLLQLAGKDCAVLILSDHGFHSDRLLPDYIPAEAAGPAVEHREFGIFCLRGGAGGPRVLQGERVYGGSVLDIAPTVLHLFGLPAGADMDGKTLINAFEDHTLPPPIASWDDVPGEDGQHDPSRHYDSAESVESLKQLVDLGYIAPPGEDVRKNVEDCLTENRYNLARSYMDAGRPDLAAAILRELVAADPEQGRLHQHLVLCCLAQRDLTAARRALEEFDRAAEEFAPRAAKELTRRRSESPDEELGKGRLSPDRRELHQRQVMAEKATGFVFDRLYLRTRIALAQARGGEKETARVMLEQFAQRAGQRAAPALFLAEGFAAVGEPARALEYLKLARRDDPEDWRAFGLEARIHFAARRYAEAANCAVDSLSLIYFQPALHLLLGASLRHLGEDEKAERECLVALAQMPGLAAAHGELARLMRKQKRLAEAALHMAQAQKLRETARRRRAETSAQRAPQVEELEMVSSAPAVAAFERWDGGEPPDRSRVVTIVTGLPRSGTSMMMQMLAAGGIEPYTDNRREADEDNPRGYYEHAQATRLDRDAAWIPQARGKAVKIVAHLAPFLPQGEEYRLVFMRRDLHEVAASQKAMLERLGRKGGNIGKAALLRTYAGQLVQVQNWLRKASGVQAITVDYAEALRDPAGAAERLAAFLGPPFDVLSAAACVDASLRRQKEAQAG
jgi:predicted AlkP superfamily phosphohydrolase/phosphomutase/tetratricopeptide (TPR) repeat protein